MTLLAITFTVMSRLEEQTSRNYSYKVSAKYLAEAGVNKAISELREQAKSGFVWTASNSWYSGYDSTTEGETLLNGCGTYTVTITDCSSQIDLNDTGNPNLARILQHLKSISYQETQDIINYRDNTLKTEDRKEAYLRKCLNKARDFEKRAAQMLDKDRKRNYINNAIGCYNLIMVSENTKLKNIARKRIEELSQN